MEKLIDLLNEYGDINWNKAMIEHQDTYIISKRFGFIERLINNDKIDFERALTNIEGKFRIEFYMKFEGVITFNDDELILMYLSISDNPIRDLISLLK